MAKLKRLSKTAFLDLTSDFLRIAKQNLQSDGYLDMIIVWVTSDGNVFITDQYNGQLSTIEQLRQQGRHEEAGDLKKQIWESVRENLEQQKAVGFFMLSDAFVTTNELKKGDVVYGEEPGQVMVPDFPLPRLDPKRREAIVINWEWKGPPQNVHMSGSIRQFYRREGNRIFLEETQREGDPFGGSAEGLLR
jgi:hypothetical protein